MNKKLLYKNNLLLKYFLVRYREGCFPEIRSKWTFVGKKLPSNATCRDYCSISDIYSVVEPGVNSSNCFCLNSTNLTPKPCNSTNKYPVYRMDAAIPFLDPDPISDFNITIEDHYESENLDKILVNVNKTFKLFFNIENKTFPMFKIDFKNIPIFYTDERVLQHKFEQLGVHNIIVTALNEKSTIPKIIQIHVTKPIVHIFDIQIEAPRSVLINNKANINYYASFGTLANCTLYRNGLKENFTYSENLTYKYIVLNTILFDRKGVAVLKVECSNLLSSNSTERNVTVEDPISGFNMTKYYLFERDQIKNISWALDHGYDVTFEIFNGTSLGKTRKYYFILPDNFTEVGWYPLDIYAKNNISELTGNTTIQIERKLSNFSLKLDNIYYKTNETFNFSMEISGSNFAYKIILLKNIVTNDLNGDFANFEIKYEMSYYEPGIYQIVGNASNIFGNSSAISDYIHVENPLKEVSVKIENSSHYNLGANFILDSKYTATNVNISVLLQNVQTREVINCGIFYFQNFELFESKCLGMTEDGFYNIISELNNNVSSTKSISSLGKIGSDIKQVKILRLEKLFFKKGDILNVNINIKEGSNINFYVSVGPWTKTKFLKNLVNDSEIHLFFFKMISPGLFNISTNISNKFGYVARQLNETIEVQEEISGFEVLTKLLFDLTKIKLFCWRIVMGNPVNTKILIKNHLYEINRLNETHFCSNITNLTVGNHNLQLWLSNDVSNTTFYTNNITVEGDLTGLSVNISKNILRSNETAIVSVNLFRGTNVHFQINTNASVTIQKSFFIQEGNNYLYQFSILGKFEGCYSLSISLFNTLSNLTSTISFMVFQPLLGINLMQIDIPTTNKPFILLLTYFQTESIPSDSNFTIFFGDGEQTSSLVRLSEFQNRVEHLYRADGFYKVIIKASNPVSYLEKEINIKVGISISSLVCNISSQLFSNRQIYSFEYFILHGTNVTLSVELGDRQAFSLLNATTNQTQKYEFKYPKTGKYNISILASNLFSTKKCEMINLEVEEPIDNIIFTSEKYLVLLTDQFVEISWNITSGSPINCLMVEKKFNESDRTIYVKDSECPRIATKLQLPVPSTIDTHYYNLSATNRISSTNKVVEVLAIREIREVYLIVSTNIWEAGILFNISVFVSQGSNYKIDIKSNHEGHLKEFYEHGDNESPKIFSFLYNFSTEGVRNITVSVGNEYSTKHESKTIRFMDKLPTVLLDTTNISSYRENVEFIFYLKDPNEKFEGATLTLETGDDQVYKYENIGLSKTKNFTITHKYTKEKFYQVKGSIKNLVSSENQSVLIKIGECIEDFTFYTNKSNFVPGERVLFKTIWKKGSNVTLIFNMAVAVEKSVKVYNKDFNLPYYFEKQGTYNVSISAENSFCHIKKWLVISVENRLAGLSLNLIGTAFVGETAKLEFSYAALGINPCLLWNFGDSTLRYMYGEKHCRNNYPDAILKSFTIERKKIRHNHVWKKTGIYSPYVLVLNSNSRAITRSKVEVIQCQKPTVSLGDFGKSVDDPMILYKSESTIFRADYTSKCNSSESVKFVWSIYDDKQSPIKIPHSDKLIFELPGKYLNYGLYTLNFTLVLEQFNLKTTEVRYLKILKSPLNIIIKGGSARSVSLREDLTVDASSSIDEDGGKIEEFIFSIRSIKSSVWNVIFRQKLESRIKRRTCGFGCLIIKPPGTGKHFIKVEAIQQNIVTKDFQELIIVDTAVFHPNLNIKCIVNCGRKVNPQQKLSLEAECSNCPQSKVFTRTWSVDIAVGNKSENVDISKYLTSGNIVFNDHIKMLLI